MRIVIVKGNLFEAESILQLARGLYPTAEFTIYTRGNEAADQFRIQPTHLALVGLSLPDIDGLDLIQEISADRLVARVLVLSDRHDEHTNRVLLRSRVDGCFDCLSEGGAELARAIRTVGDGGTHFSDAWREMRRRSELGRVLLNQILSEAELQVFAVIGDGSDDQHAAEGLGLSAKTVHTHRQRIMRKLDVSTRTELMLAAIQRGVVRITRNGVMRPGLERVLAARRSRSRDPFGTGDLSVSTV